MLLVNTPCKLSMRWMRMKNSEVTKMGESVPKGERMVTGGDII